MKNIILLSALILLSACASSRSFEADVARFHKFGEVGVGGQSVMVEPADPDKAGLEFASYANMIGEKLRRQGYAPAAGGAPADLIALVSYSGQKRQEIEAKRSPVSVGVGVGGGSGGVGVGFGTMFGVGSARQTEKSYLYILTLQLKARDSGQMLFEGRATAESDLSDISIVMPYLVDALFSDFPGPNGQTTTYEAKMDKGE